MAKEFYITTADNPYSPVTNFGEWYIFDTDKGYNSCGLLDRIVSLIEEAEPSKENVVEEAIDQIVKYDPMNLYRKVEQ